MGQKWFNLWFLNMRFLFWLFYMRKKVQGESIAQIEFLNENQLHRVCETDIVPQANCNQIYGTYLYLCKQINYMTKNKFFRLAEWQHFFFFFL